MDQSQEDGYRTRFRGWKWIYDTFESGGIRSIYWPKRSLYYQSASYKDCIQTLTCHHFSWELNIWSMGGPVQEAYVVMRLDLTEIACTPAIGSWTREAQYSNDSLQNHEQISLVHVSETTDTSPPFQSRTHNLPTSPPWLSKKKAGGYFI